MPKNKKILLLEKDSKLRRILYGAGRNIFAPGSGIPDKFLDITDLSAADTKAFELTEEIFNAMIKGPDINAVNSLFGDERAAAIFKRAVGNALKETFLSFIYAKKAINHLKLSGDILFIPKDINAEVFEALVNTGNVDTTLFRIPSGVILSKKIKEALLFCKTKVLLSFFPGLVYLFTPFGKTGAAKKKEYKYGIYLRRTDPGISSKANSMDFLIKEGIVKKEDTLFVMDGTSGVIDEAYASNVSASGYDSCLFSDMIASISREDHKRSVHTSLKKAVSIFKSAKSRSLLVLKEYLSILNIIRKWETFYTIYNVGLFFGVQEPGAVARALWQKTHGSGYCFIYLSSNIMKHVATKTYYSNIIADKLVSSMIPVSEFKEQKNHIGQYCDVGVMNADRIRRIRADEKKTSEIRSFLNIADSRYIVAVFDDNSDSYDTMPIHEIEKFMEILVRLLDEAKDTIYVYKPRALTIFNRNERIKKMYEKIRSHKSCRLVENNTVSALETMGVCDVVLTVPLSSTFTEALSAGIKTLCFVGQNYMIEGFNDGSVRDRDMFADNYEDISKNISKLLSDGQKDASQAFVEGFVKKHVDRFCDGKAFDRMRECNLAEAKK